MSIPVTNLRAGTLFKHSDNRIYCVLKYEHVKVGRGGAIIKIKARDAKTNTAKEITFNSGAKVKEVEGYRKNMQFVFCNERRQKLVFADPVTKKRFEVPKQAVSDQAAKYLKQGLEVAALYLAETDELLSIELPVSITLKVTQAPPAEKGNTAGAARKMVTLENRAVLSVPMFIKAGDEIKVNTQSGEYMGRV